MAKTDDERPAQTGPIVRAAIKKLEFAGDVTVEPADDSVTVFVGPNNAGKSATLQAMRGLLQAGKAPFASPLVSVEAERRSTLEQVIETLTPFKREDGHYEIPDVGTFNEYLFHQWGQVDSYLGLLTPLTMSFLDTTHRLADCQPAAPFDARRGQANHPFQRMYRDEKLEQAASKAVRRAFKRDLVVHRFASSSIPIYVGQRPKLKRGQNVSDFAHVSAIEALDKVENQGDGIRSYVTIVSRLVAEARTILLIDEPEAFLHPPQAKLIGRFIAENDTPRQTFVATHSSDVLQGILSVSQREVSILRFSRTGKPAKRMTNDQIKELWDDPILRFSNILDGLFHEGVVLTEGDSDCRFFEALADVGVADEDRPDLHFTYSGGKDRIAIVVKALANLGVPVATITDFDVLRSEQPLRNIIEALGGAWKDIESDWKLLKEHVEGGSAFVRVDKFREQITAELKKLPRDGAVPAEALRTIRGITKSASPWDVIKRSGYHSLSGSPRSAAENLLSSLKSKGLFVIPSGELESFCPAIEVKGRRWVERVLQMDLKEEPRLEFARSFAREIADFISS